MLTNSKKITWLVLATFIMTDLVVLARDISESSEDHRKPSKYGTKPPYLDLPSYYYGVHSIQTGDGSFVLEEPYGFISETFGIKMKTSGKTESVYYISLILFL